MDTGELQELSSNQETEEQTLGSSRFISDEDAGQLMSMMNVSFWDNSNCFEDEEDNFRNQQLFKTADIEGHISFIQDMLEQYNFQKEQCRQITEGISKVQERQNDKTLNMAVVGEFSTGKSSFINALLREPLLETDVLQGTTVVSTSIRYSKDRYLRYINNKGNAKTVKNLDAHGGLAKLLRDCAKGNTKESYPFLEVGHPSDFLRQGICIIDTPGTNSLEMWHEEVTKKTIRDKADACIVLISSDKPLPESLSGFLKENLEDVLSTCIFVVTKIDLLPKKQRAMTLEYIKITLENKLYLKNPAVLPYSALKVLREGDAQIAEQSRETEQTILAILQEQRIKIQLQRCMSLLEYTMENLKGNIEKLTEEQKQKHEQLMAAVTTDLNSFVQGEKLKFRRDFEEKTNQEGSNFKKWMRRWVNKEKNSIYEVFNGYNVLSELRAFLNQGLNKALEEGGAHVLEKAGGTGGKSPFVDIPELGMDICQEFEQAFKEEYQQLDLLMYEMNERIEMQLQVDENLAVNVQANQSIHKKAADNDSQETKVMLSSMGRYAAAGAAIGTAVPVVGTLVGTLVGGVVGLFRWGANSDDAAATEALRRQVKGDVDTLVNQYFTSIEDEIMQSYYESVSQCWDEVEKVMNRYLKKYTSAVKKMRKRDAEEQKEAAGKIQEIQSDLSRIQVRAEQIQSAKLQMSQL